jgi:phosphatidylglycerophosphate synthase
MSVVAGIVGLCGVLLVLLAQGSLGVLLGAALIDAQSILDGCDGEIARLKFQSSKIGEWIDNGTDDALNVLYCSALGVASARLLGAPALLWIGLAGGAGYAIFMAVLNYQLATVHHSGSPFVFRWWFQPPGADLHATLSGPAATTRLAATFRALGRRDVMLLAFVGLAALQLLQVATVWYALIGLSNGGVAIAHVALGGIERARRAEQAKRATSYEEPPAQAARLQP